MKKTILPILIIACLSLASCVSTGIEYYALETASGQNTVRLVINESAPLYDVTTFGYEYDGWEFTYTDKTPVRLGTIKNIQILKTALEARGYKVVAANEESDLTVVAEYSSVFAGTKVTLGFIENTTSSLLFICDGVYGWGWGIQDDLNHALLKAIESIPSV